MSPHPGFCLDFQVGIHIADVSHFVREGTSLDNAASRRHATQYLHVPASFGKPTHALGKQTPVLASAVADLLDADGGTGSSGTSSTCSVGVSPLQHILRIPMLPSDVSDACSLNPNVDRYAVTVIFKVNDEVNSRWCRKVCPLCSGAHNFAGI